MSTIKIPQNGLPQEIANIPFGQVIVLTDPEQGITSTTTQQILAIISIAGKLGQSHIVYALPVQYSGLWGCYICKVKTEEGVQVLVSDRESVLEMLCEFWGLDFSEVSKSIKLSDRYERYVFLGGVSHPVRVPVIAARKPEPEEIKDFSPLIQCLTVHTKEEDLKKIENILEDSFNHNIDISFSDIVSLLERVKTRERKTYQLKIVITKGKKEGWDVNGNVYGLKRECEFILIDPAGNPHAFKLGAQPTALYLTFILFEKGKRLADLKTDDEFYNVFKHICERLKSINSIPDKATLKEYVNDKRKEIKREIKIVTNNDKAAQELFAIEGFEGEEFKVAGATDENRDYIKEWFDLV